MKYAVWCFEEVDTGRVDGLFVYDTQSEANDANVTIRTLDKLVSEGHFTYDQMFDTYNVTLYDGIDGYSEWGVKEKFDGREIQIVNWYKPHKIHYLCASFDEEDDRIMTKREALKRIFEALEESGSHIRNVNRLSKIEVIFKAEEEMLRDLVFYEEAKKVLEAWSEMKMADSEAVDAMTQFINRNKHV